MTEALQQAVEEAAAHLSPTEQDALAAMIRKNLRSPAASTPEREQLAYTLQQEQNFVSAVLQNAGALILVLDRKGRIRRFNRACEKLSGRLFPEVEGKYLWECVLAPEEVEDVREVFSHFTEVITKGPRQTTNCWLTRDGRRRLIDWSHTLLFDAQGKAEFLISLGKDITDSKAMEEALKVSEERYLQAEMITHIGSWDLDFTTKALHWSDEIYRILGLEPRSVNATEDSLFEVMHPDDRQTVRDAIEASVADEQTPYDIEHRIMRPNGEIRVVHERGKVYRDENGQPVRLLGTAHDITERKQAEDALRQNQRLLQGLLDGITEAVFLMDLNGTVLVANETLARRIGATVPELVGSCIYDFLPPSVAQYRRGTLDKILQRGEMVRYTDSNNGRYLESAVYPVRGPRGKIDMLAIFSMDITERKRLEKSLRQSETRYRELFLKIPIPTYTWQRQGEDFVLVAYNEAALQFSNGQVASLLGTQLHDLYADNPELLDDFHKCIETQTVVRREMSYRLKSSGEQKDLWVHYAFVPPDTVMVHTEDISTRRQMEAQLRESIKEKDTLLREIHHRVKNNLQIISSLLYFQRRRAMDPQSAQVFLEGQNRLRAMILVHEQLYRAKNLSRIDFALYVRSLAQQTAQLYGQLKNKVQLVIDSDQVELPIEIALPCGMIINELLTNVFKYAFPKGQSGEASVTVHKTATGLQIQVSDDGVGLPPSFDITKPTSFGMQMLRNLTMQVKGTLHYEQNGGTTATVNINLSERTEGR